MAKQSSQSQAEAKLQLFSEAELGILHQALANATIQGKDAVTVANLLVKIENEIQSIAITNTGK